MEVSQSLHPVVRWKVDHSWNFEFFPGINGFEFAYLAFCSVCMALLVQVIISGLAESVSTDAMGSCIALAVIYLLGAFLHRASMGISMSVAMKTKLIVPGLIYRRILQTNIAALQFVNHADISKFVSEHTENIAMAILPFHYIWISPIIFLIILLVITAEFGAISLIGYLALAVLTLVQMSTTKGMEYFSKRSIFLSDKRISLINEIIDSIYLIKASVWETAMAKFVDKIRKDESKAKIWQGVFEGLGAAIQNARLWVYLLIAVIYTVTGEIIQAETIFPLAILYMTSYTWFPGKFISGIKSAESAKISFKAIQDFMELSEAEINEKVDLGADALTYFSNKIYENVENEDFLEPPDFDEEVKARDSNGTIIDLGPNSQKLVGLSGPSGSGKTMFILELLGYHRTGTVKTIRTKDGAVGFVPERNWIFPGTLRENILVGSLYDAKRYWSVVRACSLDEDLRQLKYGDQTRLGLGGYSMSNGQETKICLARAVYQDTDVYILDDPFKHIDPTTAKSIFSACIQELLAEKTRIVVIHDENLLALCDHVMLFPITIGRSPRRNSTDSSQSREFIRNFSAHEIQEIMKPKKLREHRIWSTIQNEKSQDVFTQGVTLTAMEDAFTSDICRGMQRKQFWKQEITPSFDTDLADSKEQSLWKALLRVTKTANPLFVLLLLLLSWCAPALMNCSDLTLTSWTSAKTPNFTEFDFDIGNMSDLITEDDTDSVNYGFFYKYLTLIFLTFLLYIPLAICWRITFIRATNKYHQRMIRGFLRAPMKFITEKNPGAISVNFARNVNEIDWLLISQSISYMNNFNLITFCLFIIVFINIYTAIAFIPALAALFLIKRVYHRCKLQLNRLLRDARVPYFAHFETSFAGIESARAMGLEGKLLTDFYRFQNVFISVVSIYLDLSMWLDLIVGFVGFYFILVVSYSCIVISIGTHSSSTVGLVLIYVMLVADQLGHVIRDGCEVEDKVVRLHSLLEYETFPREDPDRGSRKDPKKDDSAFSDFTPLAVRDGEIKLEKIKLRYSPRGPFVLKSFNTHIQPSEKVGLVGANGTSKTSVLNVLLRMYEFEGQVYIDGNDVKAVSLSALRRAISVLTEKIPIFPLTVRDNLDPTGSVKDEAIWNALDTVGLKEKVLDFGLGIDTQLTPELDSWNQSQKFLLSLARSMLEGAKIIFVDEAIHDIPAKDVKPVLETFDSIYSGCTVLVASKYSKLLKQTCSRLLNLEQQKKNS